MKFSEKAEETHTNVENRCKQSVKPCFSSYGRSAGKAGKCRKKPTPFPHFFRHIPKPFAEKVYAKSFCLTRDLRIHCPFSAFSENQFWVHRIAYPVARGKMPVTMRPLKQGQLPRAADGLRAVGIFL